jgi:hypothetical protein
LSYRSCAKSRRVLDVITGEVGFSPDRNSGRMDSYSL